MFYGRQWCQRAACDLPIGQHTRQTRPPTGLRGWILPPITCCAGRAQCHASGLLCSTEARWTNPSGSLFQVSNPSVRSDRSSPFWNEGDADRLRPVVLCATVEAVMFKAGERSPDRKSSHGARTLSKRCETDEASPPAEAVLEENRRSSLQIGSFNVRRCGEPPPGDSRSRAYDQARVPRRNAGGANSSTMKGP